MSDVDSLCTIGALAQAAGVNVETVRFYQRKNLLAVPPRPYGGVRRYGRAALLRLRFIRAAQRLGFTLDEVAALLRLDEGSECAAARAAAEEKLADVRARLVDLRRMERVLGQLVTQCRTQGEGDARCPLIAALAQDA